MSNLSIDVQLDRLDERLQSLAVSLTAGNSEQVQLSSQQFQQLTLELVQTLDAASRRSLMESSRLRRVQSLANVLAVIRENLLRRSAYVDRALEVIMPTTRQQPTYLGSQTYGSPVRQSGAYSVFSA